MALIVFASNLTTFVIFGDQNSFSNEQVVYASKEIAEVNSLLLGAVGWEATFSIGKLNYFCLLEETYHLYEIEWNSQVDETFINQSYN